MTQPCDNYVPGLQLFIHSFIHSFISVSEPLTERTAKVTTLQLNCRRVNVKEHLPVRLLLQPRWCCTGNMMRDLNVNSQWPATSPHESVTLDLMHPSSSSIVLNIKRRSLTSSAAELASLSPSFFTPNGSKHKIRYMKYTAAVLQ